MHKTELCELYYLLGNIALNYYADYENARELFDKSINSTTSQINQNRLNAEIKIDVESAPFVFSIFVSGLRTGIFIP